MNPEPLRRLVRSLRQSAGPDGLSPDDDAQLLRRFLSHADNNAFELLLWRHGPMVLGVCRRLLADPHDAEDAFQATFLTLVRKAASISTGAAVGAWLYRVAYRAALRLRAGLARRRRRERDGVERLTAPPPAEPLADDFRAVLDEEVNRLPARHRAAFVLCCLEGKTSAEAARQLGCPPGTVSSRLTRARAQLRRRLARRGLAPAVALAAALAGDGWAASVPALLVRSTLEAARLFASGATAGGALSPQALTLAEGVMRTMALTRIKIATTLLLFVFGFLAAGVVLTRPALDAAPVSEPRQEPPPAQTEPAQAGAGGKQRPVPVQVVRPQPGGLHRTTTQPCTVHAFDRATIMPRVSGVLKTMKVDIGDRVKQGEVLAVLDDPQLALGERLAASALKQSEGQVRAAQALVAAAKAEVVLAKGGVAQKQAELQSAQAQLNYQQKVNERIQALVKTGAVDMRIADEKGAQLEAARGKVAADKIALENARADVEVKLARLVQAEAALEMARGSVESAKLGVEKARLLNEYTQIRSPIAGVVTQRSYWVGDYLRAGDQAGSHPPLLTVDGMERMRVVVEIPDSYVPHVKRGEPVELQFEALPGVRFRAKVSRLGEVLNEKTRTMRVEIDVPNPKDQLRPGMYGTAKIQLDKRTDALLVPLTALVIRERSGHPESLGYIYVVRDGKAHATRVRIGTSGDGEVEILSGLRANDLVVLQPGVDWPSVVPVQAEERKGGR